MTQPTPSDEAHATNWAARWIADDGYPLYRISCRCGWQTANEASEQGAEASLADHARRAV